MTTSPEIEIGVWYSDELCLEVAKRLRADREANDARFVAAGRITAEQAEVRTACSAALVTLWQHFVAQTTFDGDEYAALGATWGQLRRDIAATAAATRQRADRSPDDRNLTIIAGAVETMLRELGAQPSGQTPIRVYCHDRTVRDRQAHAAADRRRAA